MKSYLLLMGLLAGFAMPSHALERSAALPYDFGNSVNKVFVPTCTANQYVAVNGNIFACKNFPSCGAGQVLSLGGAGLECKDLIPSCAAGQYLTSVNNVPTCQALPNLVPAGTLCGNFSSTSRGYAINTGCAGMATSSNKYGTFLQSCPQGYSLQVLAVENYYSSGSSYGTGGSSNSGGDFGRTYSSPGSSSMTRTTCVKN